MLKLDTRLQDINAYKLTWHLFLLRSGLHLRSILVLLLASLDRELVHANFVLHFELPLLLLCALSGGEESRHECRECYNEHRAGDECGSGVAGDLSVLVVFGLRRNWHDLHTGGNKLPVISRG